MRRNWSLSGDEELEYLKRKKLLEMRKHLLSEKAIKAQQEVETQKTIDQKEFLKTIFAENAWEVWNAAEQQFPQATNEIAKALMNLAETGKLREKLSGEQLYWLLKNIGISVRLETKIRIFESGELKTLAEKLREK